MREILYVLKSYMESIELISFKGQLGNEFVSEEETSGSTYL